MYVSEALLLIMLLDLSGFTGHIILQPPLRHESWWRESRYLAHWAWRSAKREAFFLDLIIGRCHGRVGVFASHDKLQEIRKEHVWKGLDIDTH